MTVFDPWLATRAGLEVLAGSAASDGALERLRQARWRHLLQSARAGTRLYRERLRGLPDDAPPAAVAPVSKGELMARFDEAVSDPRLSLAALRAFTADPARIAQPFLGRYLVWESSGTSGEPAVFVQDAAAMAVYDALELLRPGPAWATPRALAAPRAAARLLDPWGLTLRHAFVGVLDGHFASQVSVQRLRALNSWAAGRLRSFSILQPWTDLLAQLHDWAPQVLATYPTVAALLAAAAQRGALALPLVELRTGGETLGLAARRRILLKRIGIPRELHGDRARALRGFTRLVVQLESAHDADVVHSRMGLEARVLPCTQGVDEKLGHIPDRYDAPVLDKDPPDLLSVAVKNDTPLLQLVDLSEIIGQGALAVSARVLLRKQKGDPSRDEAKQQAHQPKGFALVETAFADLLPGVSDLLRHA